MSTSISIPIIKCHTCNSIVANTIIDTIITFRCLKCSKNKASSFEIYLNKLTSEILNYRIQTIVDGILYNLISVNYPTSQYTTLNEVTFNFYTDINLLNIKYSSQLAVKRLLKLASFN